MEAENIFEISYQAAIGKDRRFSECHSEQFVV